MLVAGWGGSARAETIVVLGRPLELSVPQGFCRLDPAIPREAALTQSIARDHAVPGRPFLTFVDCQALEAWRAGGPARFGRVGWLGLPDVAVDSMKGAWGSGYIDGVKERLPRHSAAEIAATPGSGEPALLIEAPRYFIQASMTPAQLKVTALVNIAGMALAFATVEAPAATADETALRLVESAGSLAATIGEMFAVNDIFDDVDVLSENPPNEGATIITIVAVAFSLLSFIGVRAMWLLLRAPRRRSWPLVPPGV
ncbi:hypothetical protein D3874_17540 [Oleomonas cavernae]|uniref:Uncharacterized protein n=1 Tax=Oleomonas cavernae TaxID=2320859 RepID=A0A418WF75_9PROT|nr:hypothetical protein D3874_17540 [Oleomonas cavernae]